MSLPSENIGETIRVKHTPDSYSQVTQNEGKYYILKFKNNKYVLAQYYHHPLLVKTNDYYVISKSSDDKLPIPVWTHECDKKIKLNKSNTIASELYHYFTVDKNLYGKSYSNIEDLELFNNVGEKYTLNLIKPLASADLNAYIGRVYINGEEQGADMSVSERTRIFRSISVPTNQNVNITWRQEKFYPLYNGSMSSAQLKSKMSMSNADSTESGYSVDNYTLTEYRFLSKESYFFSEQLYAQEAFGGVGDYRKNPIRVYGTIDLMVQTKATSERSFGSVSFGPEILSSSYSTLIGSGSPLYYSNAIIADMNKFFIVYEPSLYDVEIKLEPATETSEEATSYLKIKSSGSCKVSSDMTVGLGSVYMYPKITITKVEQLK